ncbi:methionine aminopeptidase 1D, mitochondrial [Arctopsyche grandis]|uniref:methionine aminopeptidase 1D, mitochondrial n=1 Tax=Arctopsyche grandis TaxID=121162 RepID=UPI00406DA127
MLRKLGLLRIFQQRNFGKYEIVKPARISPILDVPENIDKPEYYQTCEPSPALGNPEIKNETQIQHMKASCRLASSILKDLNEFVQVGITTDDIDKYVHEKCIKHRAYPSPLYYRGFPKSICTSVNNVVCHGIPDNRKLINGDIINIDITVYFEGHHGDCSKTYLIGDVDEQGKELISLTEECLKKGISVCGPGVPFVEIGYSIEELATVHRYNVFPGVLGHGIGSYFHGAPDIYHTANTYPGTMESGMTFTIEPALTRGEQMIEVLEDGWTAVTADGARSAQAEHTILINDDGFVILTDQH